MTKFLVLPVPVPDWAVESEVHFSLWNIQLPSSTILIIINSEKVKQMSKGYFLYLIDIFFGFREVEIQPLDKQIKFLVGIV